MITGRPQKYSKTFLKRIEKYLASRKDDETTIVKQERTGEKPYKIFELRAIVKLPTIEGFADFINVSRRSLYNWEKEHDDFAAGLDKIRNEQLRRLIDEGLSGTYNSTIAKLILSSNHGMVEKFDATTKGERIDKYSEEQVRRIAERILREKRTDSGTAGKGNSN